MIAKTIIKLETVDLSDKYSSIFGSSVVTDTANNKCKIVHTDVGFFGYDPLAKVELNLGSIDGGLELTPCIANGFMYIIVAETKYKIKYSKIDIESEIYD